MDKQSLIVKAGHYFENNKKLQKIVATSDGNYFYFRHFSDAQKHAKANSLIAPCIIERKDWESTKEETKPASSDKPKRVRKPRKAKIAELKDIGKTEVTETLKNIE